MGTNIAQQMANATLKYSESGEPMRPALVELLGEMLAAIAELDARTCCIVRPGEKEAMND